MDIKKDILIRTYVIFLLIIGMGVAIIGKAIYTQQAKGKYWRDLAIKAYTRNEKIEADRGTIYAEDGSVLSTSIPEFDIYVDFGADGLTNKKGKLFFENVDSLAISLANIFKDESIGDYKKELKRGFKEEDRYYLLKRKITFQQWELLKKAPLVRLGKNKSGFIADVRMKRLNPFQLFANRTIGIVRNNNKVGLEQRYDSVLRGDSGSRLVRYIAGGAAIPIDGTSIEPEDGHDIITTIDVAIQDFAEQALDKMMVDNQCLHGTCIVMETKTGKIKAMANLGRQPDGSYWEDYNYALATSEPGSTFKLATMISVLEDGLANINSPVNLEGGRWNVAGQTVFDAEFHGLYETTVQHAFEHSSNVGMAKLAYYNYYNRPSKFIEHLHTLRFDTCTGIDLPGETKGIIHRPGSKFWSNSTLPWMGFGYSVAVSPLQTLMLYNAVANGGKMMKPYIVDRVVKDGETVQQHEPVVINPKICSNNTLKQLYTCLEGVVTSGTAKALETKQYRYGAKTGTSLVADKGITYADKMYQSSFVGFFPIEDPQYTCIVVIRNRAHAVKFYGGAVAGPVFRDVADKVYGMKVKPVFLLANSMKKDSTVYQFAVQTNEGKDLMQWMGLPWIDSNHTKSNISTVASNKQYNVTIKGISTTNKTMPLIKGMVLRDALQICETSGLRTTILGKGRVQTQSILPGTIIKKGQTIHLVLM